MSQFWFPNRGLRLINSIIWLKHHSPVLWFLIWTILDLGFKGKTGHLLGISNCLKNIILALPSSRWGSVWPVPSSIPCAGRLLANGELRHLVSFPFHGPYSQDFWIIRPGSLQDNYPLQYLLDMLNQLRSSLSTLQRLMSKEVDN